ncbi:MAG: hypothetical protein HC936_07255 [Leptolyngbyaceae cyanobacterium SU_3_3]|nr:hypothetical protein [Leptolyngbyaceae cyanobacterium SU_3_3]NJR50621.1 hypothetical protein [Leptolyngbyaceae cyanobacterium CSU_1_3]
MINMTGITTILLQKRKPMQGTSTILGVRVAILDGEKLASRVLWFFVAKN